jgi:hypothetical protein
MRSMPLFRVGILTAHLDVVSGPVSCNLQDTQLRLVNQHRPASSAFCRHKALYNFREDARKITK